MMMAIIIITMVVYVAMDMGVLIGIERNVRARVRMFFFFDLSSPHYSFQVLLMLVVEDRYNEKKRILLSALIY